MVVGSTPDVVVQASQAAIEAGPVDMLGPDAPVVAEVPVDTASSTDSTEVVDPTAAEAAAPATGDVSAASLEPATVVAPAPGPGSAVPSPAPTATPTTGTPSAPAPAPVVTSGPLAPVTVAAPQTTTAPTPAPTTVAPAASLTYPSYSAGAGATVVLQFDGSSISVASVTRQPNWVSQIEQNGPRSVEIKFFNTATRQDEEFHATVEGGRIKVEN
jgi:hypothetical protein